METNAISMVSANQGDVYIHRYTPVFVAERGVFSVPENVLGFDVVAAIQAKLGRLADEKGGAVGKIVDVYR